MGLYLKPSETKPRVNWLALNAKPFTHLLAEKNSHFPWNPSADKIVLAYISGADPLGCIAVMYEKGEYLRFREGRPDAIWYSANKAEVERLLGQTL